MQEGGGMRIVFRCGHISDDGIIDGKVRQDARVCLDCIGEGKDDREQDALDWE